MPDNGEQFGRNKTQHRLKAILQGAFAGPPTALKDIPKRFGGRRAEKTPPEQRAKRHRRREQVDKRQEVVPKQHSGSE